MSTSAPTPLPPTGQDATAQAAAQTDAATDAQALATSTPATIDQQPAPAAARLCHHAGRLLARPINSAVLLGLLTYGAIHYLGDRYPPSKLKLLIAGAFALIVYGAAAAKEKNPTIGLQGLRIIANDATASSNLSLVKRLMAAWYVTFPAIVLAAAFVKRLTPTTMALAAGAAMLLPTVLRSQGIAL